MKFKNLPFVFLFLICVNCGKKEQKFTFQGKIDNRNIDYLLLANPIPLDSVSRGLFISTDTIKVDVSGKFSGEIIVPESGQIKYLVVQKDRNNELFTFFIGGGESGDFTVYTDSVYKSKLAGSALNDIYSKLNKSLDSIQNFIKQVYNELVEDGDFSLDDQYKIKSVQKSFEEKYSILFDKFIEQAKGTALEPYGLILKGDNNLKKLQDNYRELPQTVKNSYFGKELKKMMEKLKLLEVGELAYDFNLPRNTGDSLKLSSFKGSYVLLDFWTIINSDSTNIEKLKLWNKKYKDKGLKIVSISFDKDIKAWQKFIEKNSMSWTQLRDEQGALTLKYRVNSFPFQILIDKEGKLFKIVPGNDLNDEMLSTLEDIFLK